ncbi:MAG: tetratricopeptide repeat protein [Thermodesulfobacteriota bacterium]
MLFASQVQAASLEEADEAYAKGGLQNLEEAIELYEQAIQASPESFEANWKLARAYRDYALNAQRKDLEGWKDICKEYGQMGMEYAEKARELNPDAVQGHYFYGLSVSVYSDSVGIFSAISQGLRGKTKEALEKSYEIDKHYRDSTPIMALGRYWQVVLWPYRDRDKALEYYREAQEAMPEDSPYWTELRVYLGSLLLQMGQNQEEAKQVLRKATRAETGYFDQYFRQTAQEILEEHE